MKKEGSRLRKVLRWTSLAGGICITVLLLGFLAVHTWPAFGARGADILRSLIGDQAVAGLEMKFNQVQDGLQHIKYGLGLEKPAAPWTTIPAPTTTAVFTRSGFPTPETSTPLVLLPTEPLSDLKPPQPAFTPTPSMWQPIALTPLSTADEDEGVWSAYIQDAAGHSVAYRTFIQPDPERPYTLVAIVAIDLTRTRLHFVLGSIRTGRGEYPAALWRHPAGRPGCQRASGGLQWRLPSQARAIRRHGRWHPGPAAQGWIWDVGDL